MYLSREASYASRGKERPVEEMVNTWVLGVVIPGSVIAWALTQSWLVTICTAIGLPALSILQGAIGMLKYRNYFGNAPIPKTPSHGVVVVDPEDVAADRIPEDCSALSYTTTFQSVSAGLDKGVNPSILQSAADKPPIRVLVIGDSLAIGVGQLKSASPVLPEVISKTISKRLGGRAVFWTCHGAPGASTGWTVREIKRGIGRVHTDHASSKCQDEMQLSSCSSQWSDTDSSSDESSLGSDERPQKTESRELGKEKLLSEWEDMLADHCRRIDNPTAMGPYDVVVVVTGSNDLKSAFFPFLLTGEDVEARLEAKERGGSYTKELMYLLETLNQSMKQRFVSSTMRKGSVSEPNQGKDGKDGKSGIPSQKASKRSEPVSNAVGDSGEGSADKDAPSSQNGPLVVLPGMCARAMPSFQLLPLRFLSIPAVDIMDMHKRNFSRANENSVMFIPAISVNSLVQYKDSAGPMWQERRRERTVLAIRDISETDRRKIEEDMREYYDRMERKMRRCWVSWFAFLYDPIPLKEIFSIDQVHPLEEGYDCWGRMIGNDIVDRLLSNQAS